MRKRIVRESIVDGSYYSYPNCSSCSGNKVISCSKTVICSACSGTGKGELCPQGVGSYTTTPVPIQCGNCGREYSYNSSVCNKCGGHRGVWNKKDCPWCSSTSKTILIHACYGYTGQAPSCSNCLGSGTTKCSDCNGTGQRSCTACSGTGTVEISNLCSHKMGRTLYL